jgi:methyl-accepting chemotaxis protein
MNPFNLTIQARLYGTFALSVVLLLVLGTLSLLSANASNDQLNAMVAQRLAPADWLSSMQLQQSESVSKVMSVLGRRDATALQSTINLVKQRNATLNDLWSKLQALELSSRERQIADNLGRYHTEVMTFLQEALDAAEGGNFDRAQAVLKDKVELSYARLEEASAALLRAQVDLAHEMQLQAASQIKSQVVLLSLAILIGVAVVATFIGLLARSIGTSLQHAVAIADGIANGKLHNVSHASGNDELGQLLSSLQRMDAKLVQIVGSVRGSADSVGTAARELSAGNDDLSQRTQDQAAALEETASSMEQMTATVKQNADNARHANQLAVGAREQAERGGAVVQRAIAAVGEINSSSRKIADIISVIDEIAFQTNLLALNAAVEAARAGEQGRGFAVVATEVRNLAQRSASAAKEIKGLINDSVDKVRIGSELVDESGRTLSEIMESVKKVTDIVAEIAAASEEQSSGIEQVNHAVAQMDNVTQQNAALVEQASAASKSIEQQSATLVTQIGYFTSRELRPAAVAPTPVRTAPAAAAPRSVAPTTAAAPKPVPRASTPKPIAVSRVATLPRASGDDSSWQEF